MTDSPRSRPPYPSDISDRQWRSLEVYLAPEKECGRHRRTPLREVINGINYRWCTGCVWRMLPHDFPRWGTVFGYFRRWQRDGTLHRLRDVLLKPQERPSRRSRHPAAIPEQSATAASDFRNAEWPLDEHSLRQTGAAEAATDVEAAA